MRIKKRYNIISRGARHIAQWSNYSQLKGVIQGCTRLFKLQWKNFAFSPTSNASSFQTVMQEMQLTEGELMKRQQRFLYLTKMWIIFLGIACLYGLYLAWFGIWLGVFSMMALSMMIVSQIFQYHFWSFQIRQRCCTTSLREWWNFTIGK